MRPYPVDYLVTTIDGRLSDLNLITTVRLAELPEGDPRGALTYWVQSGRLAYDADGLVAATKGRLSGSKVSHRPAANERNDLLARINYNLRQNERMLAQPDPIYQAPPLVLSGSKVPCSARQSRL